MSSKIRNPREFWAGAIYAFIGLAVIVISRDYEMGTGTKMGPAYFPTILGALLAAVGALSIVRALIVAGPPVDPFAFRALATILVAIVLFGVLVRGAGLVIAIIVMVLLSSRASIRFNWRHSLALAGGLAFFSSLIFVKGLGIPLPLLGSWFGA